MNSVQRWIVLIVVYLLFLLIAMAALASVTGFIQTDPEFKKWAIGVLVVDIVAAGVAVFRTQFLSESRIRINIVFPGKKPSQVDLESCEYEIRDGSNAVKSKGTANLLHGPGGWQCHFPLVVHDADTAQLTLRERSGTVWRVRNFSPSTISVEASGA